VRRRRRQEDLFPAPLREFTESEWPPVAGECLGIFSCHGEGYGSDCVPRPGEQCADAYYAMLERDCPGRPDVMAAAKRAAAYIRWKEARLSWLGKDHPGWLEEFIVDNRADAIRYAPFRGEQ
jgi:hypothetical protein